MLLVRLGIARGKVAMRRFSAKPLLILAGLAASVLPSCATNDSMMFIIGVYARKQGTCSPTPEADAPIWANGTLDRLFASDYTAALLIGNQITERGSREQVRTETSRVSLKGAEVQLVSVKGEELAPAFSSTATGFVDAASGTDPSLTVMYATLIPGSVAADLPLGTVVAKVRVFGDTLGGEDVESSELSFPIEVCEGCLVAYTASSRDLAAGGTEYQCLVATDAADTPTIDLPCELGVDLPAPCTVCSGVYEVCLRPACNPSITSPVASDCP
ncbi:MAG TPA: hypothetical protein VIW29_17875 [Polyangiaceae bacterium]